jgi:hypothetical protein
MSPSPTRRSFIKSTAASAVAAGVAPLIVTKAKAAPKHPTVGEGEHTYECIHDWGRDSLPASANYGNASHGVTIDSDGLIYITHYGRPGSIFVFDPDGKFVRALGEQHMLNNHGGGHGIDIRTEGGEQFLYLSPSESSMSFAKMNMKGELVWQRGRAQIHEDSGKYPQGAAYRPTNISFRPDGGYYLGDGYGSNYLHQYDKSDNYVKTIGGAGKADGQFQTPHGQWLDERDGTPKLVVADRANKRLQWFDMDGKHVKTLDGFLFPADIDTRGELMLVPDLHCRVTLLDKDNKVITHLGEDAEWRQKALEGFKMRGQRDQWRPARFIHPHDACFDKDGNIFVAEWVNTGRVTKLRKV